MSVTLARATFTLPVGEVHALVGGDPAAPPLLFLHGFPDHPPTAVPFLQHLAQAHRVVAPWLRGYAPSPIVGPYDVETLAADACALIDQLGGTVDLVGHDWGAVITYAVCQQSGRRVRRAVTMSVPHPATFLRSLAYSTQWRKSWYMGLFQLPGAGWLAKRRDLALIDRLWRDWSPGFTLDDARRAELHACLSRSLPAPIEYYRAILRPLSTLADRTRKSQTMIATPLLQLHGRDDGCIVPPTEADRRWFEHRVLEIVPSVGHFLHVETPEAIAARIVRWLA
ncbi:MAG: alpha/beta hydrolase [Myxococcales bacterium]|nr:alpha/beta hydrolase [Myxococcales bacterium]